MNVCKNYKLNLFLVICTSPFCNCEECPSDHLCKGRCELVGNFKICICNPGETNWDCKLDLDLCNRDCVIGGTDNQCTKLLCNKGTCNNTLTYPFYSCNCGPFYTGQNCQIENNPCILSNANPCSNGRCEFIHGINKVNCHCNPGWKARDSETNYTIDWGSAKVIIDPPCSEQVFYGISKIAPRLSQGNNFKLCRKSRDLAYSIWYTFFNFHLAILHVMH